MKTTIPGKGITNFSTEIFPSLSKFKKLNCNNILISQTGSLRVPFFKDKKKVFKVPGPSFIYFNQYSETF